MVAYQWTSAGIAVLLAVAIVWLVRRSRLHPALACWWVIVAVAVAGVGIFPKAVDWVAMRLGVGYPPTLAGLVGVAVLLLKVLKTDIERTKDRHKLRLLAQRVAILEAELESSSAHRAESRVSDKD